MTWQRNLESISPFVLKPSGMSMYTWMRETSKAFSCKCWEGSIMGSCLPSGPLCTSSWRSTSTLTSWRGLCYYLLLRLWPTHGLISDALERILFTLLALECKVLARSLSAYLPFHCFPYPFNDGEGGTIQGWDEGGSQQRMAGLIALEKKLLNENVKREKPHYF